ILSTWEEFLEDCKGREHESYTTCYVLTNYVDDNERQSLEQRLHFLQLLPASWSLDRVESIDFLPDGSMQLDYPYALDWRTPFEFKLSSLGDALLFKTALEASRAPRKILNAFGGEVRAPTTATRTPLHAMIDERTATVAGLFLPPDKSYRKSDDPIPMKHVKSMQVVAVKGIPGTHFFG